MPRWPGCLRHRARRSAVLTGLNFLNYLDRFIPAAVLPAIIADLHLSGAQAGSLQLVFILSLRGRSRRCSGGWAIGGARFPLAAAGVFVWSAATVGSGLATTFALLILARALTGVGEASYTVVTPSLISDFYPADRRGRALAIFYAAIPVGSALGFVLGGADRRALGLARGVLRRGRAGRCAGGAAAHVPGSRRAARFDRREGASRPRRGARHVRRAARAPQLRLQHGRADHLHVRDRRPRVLDADVFRATCAASAARGGVAATSASCWCWRASPGR